MLPHFFRHYDPYVERFFIHDDASTDGSRELLAGHQAVDVGCFPRKGDSYVLDAMHFYREAWKASRGEADWVIVCNVDEHLYHPDLLGYLNRCRERGVTTVSTLGYEMVADHFPQDPRRLCDVVVRGMRWDRLDKVALFDPSAIIEIGYAPGRHEVVPTGRVVYPRRPAVKLLHFKYLGLDYLVSRQSELHDRLLPGDVANGYGIQYLKDPSAIQEDFEAVARAATTVI